MQNRLFRRRRAGFSLIQVLVTLSILVTLSLLFARQFGQMSTFLASFNSGKDASALQEDLRRLFADPLLCLQSVQPTGGQFLENPTEIPLVLPGGEHIGQGSKLMRYSLKEAIVKVISVREVFHHPIRHERVWAFEMDLVGTRTTGEALKPRALGSVYLRLDEQRKVNGCSLESRSLMRCQGGETLFMNSQKGIYECIPLAELVKNAVNCPAGMHPDLSDGGKTCAPDDHSDMEKRAIQFSNDMQKMMKDPTKLLDPENIKKILGNMQDQLQEVCKQAGGHWNGAGCDQ